MDSTLTNASGSLDQIVELAKADALAPVVFANLCGRIVDELTEIRELAVAAKGRKGAGRLIPYLEDALVAIRQMTRTHQDGQLTQLEFEIGVTFIRCVLQGALNWVEDSLEPAPTAPAPRVWLIPEGVKRFATIPHGKVGAFVAIIEGGRP